MRSDDSGVGAGILELVKVRLRWNVGGMGEAGAGVWGAGTRQGWVALRGSQ